MTTMVEFPTSVHALVLFGVASGVLSIFAYIPYIFDTIAQRTQPQRASWLIWSVLGSIAFMSQVYEGATSSLWFAGVQISGTIIVFVLSIWVGKGRYLSRADCLILAAATVGLVLWYFTETAAYALAITIGISLLGGVATVIKAYRDPASETLITWVVSLIAAVCAILSVGEFNIIILAYPLYLFTLYLAFVVAIVLGHARIRARPRPRAAESVQPAITFAGLFSGLRTTADVIVFVAAVAFAFNWLDNNRDNNLDNNLDNNRDNTESDRFAIRAAQPSVYARPDSLLVAVPKPAGGDTKLFTEKLAVKPVALAELGQQQAVGTGAYGSEAKILVVAVQVDAGLLAEPRVLDDQDPLAIIAKSTARRLLANRHSIESTDTTKVPDLLVESAALSGFDDVRGMGSESVSESVSERGGEIIGGVVNRSVVSLPAFDRESGSQWEVAATQDSHVNNRAINTQADPSPFVGYPLTAMRSAELKWSGPGDDSESYHLLDEGDPFARLIVTSSTARIVIPETLAVVPRNGLPQNARLQALATNGEWFRVRTKGGLQGYIHRSHVAVEAFAQLSEKVANYKR